MPGPAGSGDEEEAAAAGIAGEDVGAELVDDGVVPGRRGPLRFGRNDVLGQGRPASSRLLSMMGKRI